MSGKKIIIFVAIIVALFIVLYLVGFFDEDKSRVGDYESQKTFYIIPPTCWFKISFWGIVSAVVIYLALAFGLASYFIGYNAGGRLNKSKIISAIGTAVVVGIIGRSFKIFLQLKLFRLLIKICPESWGNPVVVAGTISDVVVYVLWLIFISGIAVFLYETFVVTAQEAKIR